MWQTVGFTSITYRILSRRIAGVAATAISLCAVAGELSLSSSVEAQPEKQAPKARMWQDRGALTPKQVYWGPGSEHESPMSRLPHPPFSQFKKDDTPGALNPKGKVVDRNGVSWTIKFGEEVHSDVVAPRIAWALGYSAIESYYIGAVRIDGITKDTDFGRAKGWISKDGNARGGVRFKRKDDRELEDDQGRDVNWELRTNPGVPPEHISGLRLLNVLVNNWDIHPKNCKVLRKDGPDGPENWFYVSDLGATFGASFWGKFHRRAFEDDQTFVKSVDREHMHFHFSSALNSRSQQDVHRRVPLAHVRWFVDQFDRIPDEGLRAAFDAAFATDALNAAYSEGNPDVIERVREQELSEKTLVDISRFVSKLRSRVDEMKRRLPSVSTARGTS